MYELFVCDSTLAFMWDGLALYDGDNEYALKATERFAKRYVDAYDLGMVDVPRLLELVEIEAPGKSGTRVRYMDIWHKWGLPARPRSNKPTPRKGAGRYSVWAEGVPKIYPHSIRFGSFDDDADAVDWLLNIAGFYAQESIDCGLTSLPVWFAVYDGDRLDNRIVAKRNARDALAEERWFDQYYAVTNAPPCPVERSADYFRRFVQLKDILENAEQGEPAERKEGAEEPKKAACEQLTLF